MQNQERSVVTTRDSDITNYASYLPIYHNESYVYFQPKYVSLFITLDNVAYVVPADAPGMCAVASALYDEICVTYVQMLMGSQLSLSPITKQQISKKN